MGAEIQEHYQRGEEAARLAQGHGRLTALREGGRVLRPGGALLAAGISRFSSTFDGLFRGYWDDPSFVEIIRQDLRTGQHHNPGGHAAYFTTAYLHRPDELKVDLEAAGLSVEHLASATTGVPGAMWWGRGRAAVIRDA